jgi:hypothetical protein
MNKVENNLNNYANYFNGFKDVWEGQSKKQIAIGFLKIISYLTPASIYFGLKLYFEQRQLNNMKSLCNRVSLGLQNKTAIDQKDLIKFLVIKILDQDKTNFDGAFHLLSLKSQSIFFETVAENGKLCETIQYLPRDIKHIAINFGKSPLQMLIGTVASKLEKFDELETVDFDMSEVCPYTADTLNKCHNLIKIANCFEKSNAGWYGFYDNFESGGSSYSIDTEAIAREVINDSICLIKAKEKIKVIRIHFMGSEEPDYLKTYSEEIHKTKDKQLFHKPNHPIFAQLDQL